MQKIKNWWKELREDIVLATIVVFLENRLLFWLFRKTVRLLAWLEKAGREKVANQQIDRLQSKLVKLANLMYEDGDICFRSGSYRGSEEGGYWKLIDNSGQKVSGDFLFGYLEKRKYLMEADHRMEKALSLTLKICQDFQLLVKEKLHQDKVLMQSGGGREDFLTKKEIVAQGKKWIFGKLLLWSGPIVEAGLMKHGEVAAISEEFEKLVLFEGECLFGYCHGNIIGNHIFFPEGLDVPHLLGMRLVIRPGRGYYDFLRALDWCLLELPEYEGKEGVVNMILDCIPIPGKTIIKESDSLVGHPRIWRVEDEEIRLIFALRCIGVLGWDMLHLGNLGHGNAEKKKEILLRFIRREN